MYCTGKIQVHGNQVRIRHNMLLWFVKIYERNLKKLQFTTQPVWPECRNVGSWIVTSSGYVHKFLQTNVLYVGEIGKNISILGGMARNLHWDPCTKLKVGSHITGLARFIYSI